MVVLTYTGYGKNISQHKNNKIYYYDFSHAHLADFHKFCVLCCIYLTHTHTEMMVLVLQTLRTDFADFAVTEFQLGYSVIMKYYFMRT